jgi:cytoskeletal protein CcmA (bactofilin family)
MEPDMNDERGEINALLGHGTEFDGKLTFQGTVRIDGAFSGEIMTDDVLIIGEGAEVRAEISVRTLIIRGGVVHGNITAKELVEIHAPGKLVGNIVSPQLFIDKGVIFQGECRMEDLSSVE